MSRSFLRPAISRAIAFAGLTAILIPGISVFQPAVAIDSQKDEEIREMMWNSGDEDFQVIEIPEKWADQSAVIIAKSNNLSYKKDVLINNLRYNREVHIRIKLLNQTALEKYAQFSIPESGSLANINFEYFAGFKVIKPDGREIVLSLADAVKEEKNINDHGINILKLAIPNLEVGDILDYYIVNEQEIKISTKFHNFDAMIFQLHDEYPIMKQKISFDVLRRCFINLKSLNGSSEFKVTEDTDSDKNYYYFEDSDRESTHEIRWMYPNRELPTIKFRVLYASSMIANLLPSFMGTPGVLKTNVTESELLNYVTENFKYAKGNSYSLMKYMKKNYKKETDPEVLATEAFYYLRNAERMSYLEPKTITKQETNPAPSTMYFVQMLSYFLESRNIDHEILLGVPRDISSLDDLILETELTYMLKVNTPEPLYFGRFENNSLPGEIDPELQGTKMYSINASDPTLKWRLSKVDIPVIDFEENKLTTNVKLDHLDLSNGEITMNLTKSFKGLTRVYHQNVLMDVFDFIDEEKRKFPDTQTSYSIMSRKDQERMAEMKSDYLSKKDENNLELMRALLEADYEFEIKDVEDFKLVEHGRTSENPEFTFECSVKSGGVMKKAGPNYLLDIGKFIENQVELTEEEKTREYDVYMPFARTYQYEIEFAIPEGYSIQGVDKLNMDVENETGKFISYAKIEGDKLVISTEKSYYSNYEKKEDWPKMIEFLEAAKGFNELQVLLKKN